jgi:hypothetical protein
MSFAGSGIDNKLGSHKHLPGKIADSGRKFNTKTPNIKSPAAVKTSEVCLRRRQARVKLRMSGLKF